MKKQRTIYQLIVDRSGSMSDCIENTVTGFNEQVNRIRQIEHKFSDQKIVMGLTSFNHKIEHHLHLVPTQSIPTLTKSMYLPDGYTALLDAIGLTVKKLEHEVTEEEHIDTTCVVVVLTDGHENASKYYTLDFVRELIKRLEATGKWTFCFIGATLDAVDVAEKMNISRNNSFSFEKKSMKEEVWDKLGDSLDSYMAKKVSGNKILKDFIEKK